MGRRGPLPAAAGLVTRGVVVAAVAVGTAGVVDAHAEITLDVDGQVRTVDGYGDTVADVLAFHGITPGPDDLVQPALSGSAPDDGEVVVRTSRDVTMEIDGETVTFPTTAHTVGELLAALGPRGEGAVTTASRSDLLGRSPVRVSTLKTVHVSVDGAVLPLRTTQATVREVLDEVGITLAAQDGTSVPLGAAAVDGMVVVVHRGQSASDVVTEVVPFETETVESDELPRGREIVQTRGVPGERVTTYEVRTIDGTEVERTVVERTVTVEPVTEVVLVGTLDIADMQVDPSSAKAVARSLVAERGWGDDQFICLDQLWEKESGWRWNAENPSSGAYGIPQALPGSKMQSAGSDWQTNPTTQIIWGLDYITGRYGTPCEAWDHSMTVGWY
ncbi:ubiquitin-like domain-containing protein [Isoptericola sp. 178]|uniref:aggregation-promoting factor C-terminal-like domain-containing protein n=1 Tax=Isoptericola sp. 178 TaxID=3064651 RepID=UPI002712BE70|nr:ubiquitin-like domain-containing protein [Isoptericola sp. 178]MDO8144012.1 ubiquitin-like domain-containing protein [Isoptericola sp. 178]